MYQSRNGAQRKLPLKAQPNINQHSNNRQNHCQNGRLNQLTRHFWPHAFNRNKRNIRRFALQCRQGILDDIGGYGFFAVLGLNADHRHILIILETGIIYFRDGDIAQVQLPQSRSVGRNIHHLRALGPNRCATTKVDPEIQPLHQERDQRSNQ